MSKKSSDHLTRGFEKRPDFAAIKAAADLVSVIESHGVALKKEGRDYVGLCPFHDDKTPSLRVTPGKGLWRCMGCEAAGNVIQFVAKKRKPHRPGSRVAAARFVAGRADGRSVGRSAAARRWSRRRRGPGAKAQG